MRNFFKSKSPGRSPHGSWQQLDGISLASARLSRLSCFDGEGYRRRHPDIGDKEASRHFVTYGVLEGRIAAEPLHLARLIGQVQEGLKSQTVADASRAAPGPQSFAVFSSSLGNSFMREIARTLARTLRVAGHAVLELDENHPIQDARSTSIFVAPHEFFLLGKGPEWLRDDVLGTAFMYCTEQPQTQWFWRVLPIVLMARGVNDISPMTAALFAEVMPAAGIRPFPYRDERDFSETERGHPLLQARKAQLDWSVACRDFSRRPLDLSFMAAASDNRNDFFYRNARLLSGLEGFFYMRQRNANRVLSEDIDQIDLSAVGSLIARNSKIALNVHRDEFPYFEWHRMVYQAMANGALVLSEPCFPDEHYVAGRHFLTEESRYMGQKIEWLLRTEDGLAAAENTIRQARLLLEQELPPLSIAERLAAFMTEAR